MALTTSCFNVKSQKAPPAQPADALANIETNPVYSVIFDGSLKREDKIERLSLLFSNAAAGGSRLDKCLEDVKTMHRYLLQEHADTSMEIFKLSLSAEGAAKDKLNDTASDLNKAVFNAYGMIHAAFNTAGMPKHEVVAGVTATYEKFNRICGHEPAENTPANLPAVAIEAPARRAPLRAIQKLG